MILPQPGTDYPHFYESSSCPGKPSMEAQVETWTTYTTMSIVDWERGEVVSYEVIPHQAD